jgi:hypothetical protein
MNFGGCAVCGDLFGRAARMALNARDLAERVVVFERWVETGRRA